MYIALRIPECVVECFVECAAVHVAVRFAVCIAVCVAVCVALYVAVHIEVCFAIQFVLQCQPAEFVYIETLNFIVVHIRVLLQNFLIFSRAGVRNNVKRNLHRD